MSAGDSLVSAVTAVIVIGVGVVIGIAIGTVIAILARAPTGGTTSERNGRGMKGKSKDRPSFRRCGTVLVCR